MGALPWPCGLCDQFCCIRVTQPIDHFLFLTVWSSVNPGFLFTLCTIPNQSQFLALTLFICKFHHHGFCCQIALSLKLLHLTFQFMKCNYQNVYIHIYIYIYESLSELCCNKKSHIVWHFFKQKFAWFIKTCPKLPWHHNVQLSFWFWSFCLFLIVSFNLFVFFCVYVWYHSIRCLKGLKSYSLWPNYKVTLTDPLTKGRYRSARPGKK